MAITQNKQSAKFSALAGLIGLAMILGFFGTTANASVSGSNQLSSSNPAPNQVVSVPPTQLQLVFRDALANPDVVTNMGLSLACNGTLVGLGVPQLGTDFKTVSAALTQIPPSGLCTVSWALPDRSIARLVLPPQLRFKPRFRVRPTVALAMQMAQAAELQQLLEKLSNNKNLRRE